MTSPFPPDLGRPYPTHVLGRRQDFAIPSPRWIDHHAPGWAPEVAVEGGLVRFCGRDWAFAGDPLPDGTVVLPWFDARACVVACVARADHDAWRAAEAARREEEAERREAPVRAAAERRRSEAVAWLERFEPPFRWSLGHKPVLSGLLERSAGNGVNAASVDHVMLLEPFRQGRLTRAAGEMLCAAGQGSYDNREDPGAPSDRMPTCKGCLAKATRWLRQRDEDGG